MEIVKKYEWSCTAEEEVMLDAIEYDKHYTKLFSSLVIQENQISRSG